MATGPFYVRLSNKRPMHDGARLGKWHRAWMSRGYVFTSCVRSFPAECLKIRRVSPEGSADWCRRCLRIERALGGGVFARGSANVGDR